MNIGTAARDVHAWPEGSASIPMLLAAISVAAMGLIYRRRDTAGATVTTGARGSSGDFRLFVRIDQDQTGSHLRRIGLEPGKNLKAPVAMLGQRRAALDPIAAVHVADAEIVMDHGVMDVAANDAVNIAALRLRGERLFECTDIVDGILDLALCPLRQRPIRKAEPAANRVEVAIDQDGEIVSGIAQEREPARVFDHHVEHVAVHDQIAAAVGTFVDRRFHHLDAAEMRAVIIAQELIVVAGQIDETGALAGLAQKLLYHVIMRLRPIPALAQLPTVDNVADQINRVRIMITQEVEKPFSLAAARAEMNIRNEQSTEQTRAVLKCHDV
jgi:hypothetical protein